MPVAMSTVETIPAPMPTEDAIAGATPMVETTLAPARLAEAQTASDQTAPADGFEPEVVIGGPSASALAAVRANPEAAAALAADDPLGFARAMGIEPSAAFLEAAAAPGSPFDCKTTGPWLAAQTADLSKA